MPIDIHILKTQSHHTDMRLASTVCQYLIYLISAVMHASVLIGTFYRSPSTSKHHDSDFMSKLEVELSTATATDKEVIILEDFNCDLVPSRSINSDCKQLQSVL